LYHLFHFSPIFFTGIIRVFEIIIIIIYILKKEGHCRSVGCGISQLKTGLKYGLVWSFLFGIIVFSIFYIYILFFKINLFNMIRMPIPDSLMNQIGNFFIGCMIGPFAEEIVFRGVIYGFFRKWGIIIACCLSTLIFVFLHLNAPVIPLTQIVGGILFAVSYEHTKILYTPVTIHILGNSCMLFLSYLKVNL